MSKLLRILNFTITEIILVCSTIYALEINTNGQTGALRTFDAEISEKGTLNIGTGFGFQQSADYLKGPVTNNSYQSITGPDGSVIDKSSIETARLFSSNFFLAVSPFSFLNVGISLPFYYDWSGISHVNEGGIGDLRFSTKIETPTKLKGFHQGYYISGTIPTGIKKNGIFPRHSYIIENSENTSYYTTGSSTLTGLLLLSFDIGAFQPRFPIQLHLNAGGSATASKLDQRNLVLASIAVEYMPLNFLTIFMDLSGETRMENISTDINPTDDPLMLTPGLKINTPSGLYLQLAGEFSLSSKKTHARVNQKPQSGAAKGYEYSTGVIPSYGAQFVLGWNGFMTVQDDDRDGIKNNLDRCPKDPEDFDGFEDNDGCPDYDNDKDGIPDSQDRCPNLAEDIDGFKDEDGCPDPDNDGDGIADLNDQCPNLAEDKDGFEDSDGCPDLDNDKDGIVDSLDKCINEPEDFDGFEDSDGCPDPDNDNDGIDDVNDKCPLQPETVNKYMDDDGCPDSVKKESGIPSQQILRDVQFRSNGPEMTFSSYQYIEPLIRQMKQFPEVEIEVRCYTDSLGAFSKNMQLSQMRAEAVRQYIASKGVDSKRIRAVGFGPTNPIADNRTATGRAQNRRVEIVVIQ